MITIKSIHPNALSIMENVLKEMWSSFECNKFATSWNLWISFVAVVKNFIKLKVYIMKNIVKLITEVFVLRNYWKTKSSKSKAGKR